MKDFRPMDMFPYLDTIRRMRDFQIAAGVIKDFQLFGDKVNGGTDIGRHSPSQSDQRTGRTALQSDSGKTPR